jgi:hypothetical protein
MGVLWMRLARGASTRDGDGFLLLAAIAMGETWAINIAQFEHVQPQLVCLSILGLVCTFLTIGSKPPAAPLTLLYIVVVGIAERIALSPIRASDAVDATREALPIVFSGANPYLHSFVMTRPPGSPFPYLPGELLFYGIPYLFFHSIAGVDKAVGIATVILIATAAPIVGAGRASVCVGLYAVFLRAAWNSVDGSNDGALAFLLLLAVVLSAWSEFAQKYTGKCMHVFSTSAFYASAFFLAWALLFKALSWPFFIFIQLYLNQTSRYAGRYFGIVTATCVLTATPFLISYPGALLANVWRGFVFHQNVWGFNVWAAAQSAGMPKPPAHTISILGLGIVVCVFIALLRHRSRSLGEAVMCGAGMLFTVLLSARWATSPYYTFVMTIFPVAAALIRLPEKTNFVKLP